ncbi:MAG: heparinase II/III family protein [Deltaproteobacteria bacterium]|nr:heparinase II/III family protein [Deltaproteobacteria bacterium]
MAQRLIHWMLALQLFADIPEAADLVRWITREAFREYAYLQMYNTMHYDRRNNFAFCECVACIVFLKTFIRTTLAREQLSLWERRLLQECEQQIDADGFTREGSFAYSRFIGELLLLAANYGVRDVLPYLQRMAAFLRAMVTAQGMLPAFGDASTERGFTLGVVDDINDARTFFALVEALSPDGLLVGSGGVDVEYLMFTGACHRPNGVSDSPGRRIFRVAGYGAARYSWGKMVIDFADIGMSGRGGHGHCDVGSYTVETSVGALVVDPGTNIYFQDRALRNLYRSAAMHNITRIDGAEMCVLGPGLFEVSHAPRVFWSHDLQADGERYSVEHEGFIVAAHRVPVMREVRVHSRGIDVSDRCRVDLLEARSVVSAIHFAPCWRVVQDGDRYQLIGMSDVRWELSIREALQHERVQYDYSDGYGRVTPAAKIIMQGRSEIHYSLTCCDLEPCRQVDR